MVKIRRLNFFVALRIVEASILLYLWLINSYTVENLRFMILTLTLATVVVLIANFSNDKKFEKYNPPLNIGFFFLLLILLGLEVVFLFLAPLGYLDFVTARWMIGGIEAILLICLGFTRKLDLL